MIHDPRCYCQRSSRYIFNPDSMVVPLHVSQVFRFKDSGRRTHSSQPSSSSLCHIVFKFVSSDPLWHCATPFWRALVANAWLSQSQLHKNQLPLNALSLSLIRCGRAEKVWSATHKSEMRVVIGVADFTSIYSHPASRLSSQGSRRCVRLPPFHQHQVFAGMRRDDILRRFRYVMFR